MAALVEYYATVFVCLAPFAVVSSEKLVTRQVLIGPIVRQLWLSIGGLRLRHLTHDWD